MRSRMPCIFRTILSRSRLRHSTKPGQAVERGRDRATSDHQRPQRPGSRSGGRGLHQRRDLGRRYGRWDVHPHVPHGAVVDGADYQALLGRRPLRYLIVAIALLHFSSSWFYDAYLRWRDGAYTARWAGDLILSPIICLAAGIGSQLLREHFPTLRVRVVNVVDLIRLQSVEDHPHGLNDAQFDSLFTADRPVIFAYHGYPALIHRLTYRRTNHDNFHVHGFCEKGTTTTPFDMVALTGIDRFHLFAAVVSRVTALHEHRAKVDEFVRTKLDAHTRYIQEWGIDMPEILDWRWRT